MNAGYLFYGFEFYDHLVGNEQISPESFINDQTVIYNRYWNLPKNRHASFG